MIYVTRLSGERYLLNAELIQEIEETPDTVVTLISGKKQIVKESLTALRDAVIEYKQAIAGGIAPPRGS